MKFLVLLLLFPNFVTLTWSGSVVYRGNYPKEKFWAYKSYPVPRSGSLISTYPMTQTHEQARIYFNDGSDSYNYLTEPEVSKPLIKNRLSQVTNAIGALKIGSGIVIAKLFIGVIILALITSAGTKFAPIVLPLFLLPIGFLALLIFVPVFIVALILVAIAHEEGLELKRRRKKRSSHQEQEYFRETMNAITTQVEKSLDKFNFKP